VDAHKSPGSSLITLSAAIHFQIETVPISEQIEKPIRSDRESPESDFDAELTKASDVDVNPLFINLFAALTDCFSVSNAIGISFASFMDAPPLGKKRWGKRFSVKFC
jgi:hypothetical protein